MMDFLWEMTLGMTITAGTILLFKKLFKGKLSARWHVWIWVLLLIRLAAPVLPESEFSFLNMVPEREVIFEEWTELPVDGEETAHQEENIPKSGLMLIPEKLAAGVWVTGAVLLFGYFAAVSVTFSMHTGRRRPVTDPSVIGILTDCKSRLGIHRDVQVVSGEEPPMMTGFFRPKIILRSGYSHGEVKDIFIHELCHLKHGDLLAIWTATAVLCLNWFNPLIWHAFFVFRRDIEVCCDQRALRYCENKGQYAMLLLRTALDRRTFVPGTTGLRSSKKEVERRISYMAEFKKPGVMWTLIIVFAAVLIGAGCLTNGTADTAQAGVNDETGAEVIRLIRPTGGEITADFGSNPITGWQHTGVDFAGSLGDPVVAAAGGEVSEAGFDNKDGYFVRIVHGTGIETFYAHLSETLVEPGETVEAGQQIGGVGQTGQATGPCLHFELIADGQSVNPQEKF